ncbi:MAG: AtzE family amidohydrolase [Betaproteobacteria bacterium]|nr:AtzE family amidohydrolase [Betaproteobacteria bacterium]
MSLHNLSSAEITQGISRGSFSASEVLQSSLDRIEATDKKVNAFTAKHIDRAIQKAQSIDALRASGASLPPLAGVPFAVKNLFDVQGQVTLAGSIVNRHHAPAEQDAFLIQQMTAAGAVLVGSLNMDEFAYGFTTENTHYGPCRNPHDTTRISGGSSGGSGTAVAAHQVPLTLGSDTNGSIRVPASLCGVWGLKPTFGRLSRRGTFPFVNSIDHLGGFANSLDGLATMYDAMQSPDAQDPGCHVKKIEPVLPTLQQGTKGLRIGVLNGFFEDNASSQAREVVARAAKALGVHAQVEWPDATLGRIAAFIITASEGGALHLDNLRHRIEEMEPLSVDRFMSGALQPAAWYIKAQKFRRIYRDKVNALFENWDVLLAPATPVSAPVIGTEWLEIQDQTLPSRAAMGLLTQPISFAGCPVIAAPMWPSSNDGLPLGIQIISAPWREDLAFRVAKQLETLGVCHLKEVKL